MALFRIFSCFPELNYGWSEKADGSMKSTGNSADDGDIEKNQRKFFEKSEVEGFIFSPELTHSSDIAVIDEGNRTKPVKADGLITSSANLFLTITFADCFPVYFYEPESKIVGLAHCGWRGIAGGIIFNMAKTFEKEFSAKAEKFRAAIGPGIQKCHFVVRDDVLDKFKGYEKFIEKRKENYAVDLGGIITEQARQAGINRIESSKLCTFCDADKFFSFRRDKAEPLQAMVAYIGRTGSF